MSTHKASIDVVAAVIMKNNLFLIANRSFEDNSQGIWEFPGGKVEENETFTSALIREIKEELSLNIKVGNKIATIDLNKIGKNIYVHYYYAVTLSGQISINVHSEFKWVPHTQLKNFTYIDGDRHILNYL
ncbi:NUDIX domain-containing protein [Paracoccaceae bacterium]|nr:NUDIX domain-containing protein [Paracoccaceae bacterium]